MIFTAELSSTKGHIVGAVMFLCVLPISAAQPQNPAVGGTYAQLLPQQKAIVNRSMSEFETVFKQRVEPQKTYDQLPLSARTTFQAVTHALLNTKLTSEDGKPLGTALDLVDFVERVAGQAPETRGDAQFRIYVYLKHGAVNKLYAAKEFQRAHDNTVYHIGYPINFRQQGAVPALQFSVARTGLRADIDVDYRSSSAVKALVNGHLTAANSDVRAGQNDMVHNRRWNGLPNWWKDLLAAFTGQVPAEEATPLFPPEAELERKRIARGPIHDAVHSYLTDWLIDQKPELLLPLISIKSFPCVAEFRDGAQSDSKLALVRILRRMQERNKSLGKVARLEDVVQPVPYPLPGAVPVSQQYSNLFALQEVYEDVAWAIDCRIRYKMQLVESIPRPPHRLNKTYVVSMRVKDSKEPEAFVVQTWKQESGEWRLVSFDVKRKSTAPPADLVAAADPLPPPDSDEKQLSTQAAKLLTTWLMQKQPAEAVKFFLPESFACNEFADSTDTGGKPSEPADSQNLMRFLDEAAKHAVPNPKLEGVVAAPEAGHHDLKPVAHSQEGAFLLAQVSGELLRMSPCGSSPKAARKRPVASALPRTGMATAFRLVQPDGDQNAVITLYWKKSQSDWRVSSYNTAID